MVKSAYLALHNLRFGSNMVEEFKCLWKNKIPHKVSFLIWRVLHDRLPTTRITYIKDVHIQFLDDGLACVPCGHVVEDSYHVFFFFIKFAQLLWWRWYGLLDICSVPPGSPIEHFCQISHRLQGHVLNSWWKAGWCVIIWNIWYNRNKILSGGGEGVAQDTF